MSGIKPCVGTIFVRISTQPHHLPPTTMNTLGQLLVLISLLWVCIACSHAAVVSLSWEVSTGWVNPDGVWRTAYVFKDLVLLQEQP
jgi:hypothetical protein